jgi:hypothetical protein
MDQPLKQVFCKAELEEIIRGAVVYVRAVVTGKRVGDWSTTVAVEAFEPYGGHDWAHDNINSVDIYILKEKATNGSAS